jgi:hypothetical protein
MQSHNLQRAVLPDGEDGKSWLRGMCEQWKKTPQEERGQAYPN